MYPAIILYNVFKLLRYISEWNPRKPANTKGGYIRGKINIPRRKGKLRMVIQTIPAEDVQPMIKDIHPCILHVVRIGKGKRYQHLEPVPSHLHWKQTFEIDNGKVKILNRLSDLDVGNDCVPQFDDIAEVVGHSILLGGKNGMLNLVLLQSKQTQNKKSDTTIAKVLADRLPTASEKDIDLYKKQFIRNPKNLNRIRLKVDFYTENGEHCGSSISPVIIDTKDRDVGVIDFYDATPLKSCVKGGRKITMISEYELAKDVFPVFQVYDSKGHHRSDLDVFLTQPEEVKTKNLTIIFITPEQKNLQNIQLKLNNYSIKLVGKRKWDGHTSNKKFNFRFEEHVLNNCPFCDHKVDSEDPIMIEAELNRAKPGEIKRQMYPLSAKSKDDNNPSMSSVTSSSGVSELWDESNGEYDELGSIRKNDDICEIDFNEINDRYYDFESEESFEAEEVHARPGEMKSLNHSEAKINAKQSVSSSIASSGISKSLKAPKKGKYEEQMKFTHMGTASNCNGISLEDCITSFIEDIGLNVKMNLADTSYDTNGTKSDSCHPGLQNNDPHCNPTHTGMISPDDPRMSQETGNTLNEDTVGNAERYSIFMDGGNTAKHGELISKSNIQKEKIVLKTKTGLDCGKMKNGKDAGIWDWFTVYIENIPLVSIIFMMLFIMFQAVAEFATEISLFFLVSICFVVGLLMMNMKSKMEGFEVTNICKNEADKRRNKIRL